MRKAVFAFVALLALSASLVAGAKNPIVGGHEMLPTRNIIENLSDSTDHTTFVALLKSTGLGEMLRGAGPFTVFAPTNQAFAELPKGMMDNLQKPENKEQLKQLLRYHIVRGKWSTADLKTKIKEGEGKTILTSLQGSKLSVADHAGMHLMVRDEDDDIGMFNVSDVMQSNGVVHVIDNVMQPK